MSKAEALYAVAYGMTIGFCLTVLAITCYGLLPSEVRKEAYRQGQIDAANGVMKYELKKLPTGETVWVKKGTPNEK